jgi:tRNA-2-methylthio-N6-dimethylallyladenosine synthase
MNEDDTLQMESLLKQMGYRQASDESDADIIVLNTCSVRAKPEQKALSKLGELRALKEENRRLIVVVCGCMAQREGRNLLKKSPVVDIVLGTGNIPELPHLIERIRGGERRLVAVDLPPRDGAPKVAEGKRVIGEVGLKMFVPVMYGCNNFCAYCIVPFARGPERSRRPEEIVEEITELAARGCREVTLVGQNVNSYGQTLADGSTDFPRLLEMVSGIEDLKRIRFFTSHPKDLSERLIDAMSDLPKVCEHLHLPLQAGDDEILRRMGRGYTVEHYRSLVEKLRSRVPGIALTTDVMVGFPGETEDQFNHTLETIESIRFDGAFMFAYNPRPGTAAARMGDQIDAAVKRRRLNALIAAEEEISLEKLQSVVGGTFEVMVEGQSEKDHRRLTGYTRTNRTVNFLGKDGILPGDLVTVRAKKAHPWGFTGELVEE